MKVLIILILVTAVALADEEPLQAFIKANNLFASAAYKEVLKDSPGNFLVSPLSAETALAFAQSGCKDETAQEIRSALRLPDDKSKIEDGIRSLLPQLKGGDNYALHSANKMYIKEDFTVKEEFRKVATEVFQAGSESIDFTKRDQAAETMN
ncbi:Serpin domain containing protein, partial [Asbolus verrucosus]